MWCIVFRKPTALDLSVLSDGDKVLGSYRHDVSELIPKATRIAWSLKKDEIMKDQPGPKTSARFLVRSSCDVTASHFTLRHHNAARVKVCVRSRRLVLVPGVDGRNIQVRTRIVIGRS